MAVVQQQHAAWKLPIVRASSVSATTFGSFVPASLSGTFEWSKITNDGTDQSQLSHVANETKAVLGVEKLDAVAGRGYFNSEEIRAAARRRHAAQTL